MNRYLKMDLSRAEAVEGNIVPAVISTDTPVDRGEYNEILEHTPEAINIRGGGDLPLLTAHDNQEPAIGKVTNIQLDNGKLRAELEFGTSTRAVELLEDIKRKVINGVSIGYRILEREMDGRNLIAKSWELFEASIVGVQADLETGFYRSQNKEKIMNTENSIDTVKEERTRCSEITEIGKRFKHEEDANTAIASGESLDSFRSKVLDNVQSKAVATPFIKEVGDSQREYSMFSAIQGLLNPQMRGYEFEVSQDQERKYWAPRLANSVLVPFEKRVITKATAGANTTATDVRQVIDFVQQEAVFPKLGVTQFSGLSSSFMIPRGTNDVTTSFLALDGSTAITESTPTLSNTILNPRSLASIVQVSHKFIVQSSVDAEAWLKRLMATSIANKLDYAIFDGSGSSNQPDGILNVSGIGQVDYGAAPTYAKILDTIALLPASNHKLSSCNWVINPADMAVLASTVKVAGEPDFLLDLDVDGTTGRVGYMAGFPVYVDKNISATEYLFGDFSNYGLGFFGSMEMAVDHEYDFAKGNIAIRTIQDFDGSVLTNSGFARCHT